MGPFVPLRPEKRPTAARVRPYAGGNCLTSMLSHAYLDKHPKTNRKCRYFAGFYPPLRAGSTPPRARLLASTGAAPLARPLHSAAV